MRALELEEVGECTLAGRRRLHKKESKGQSTAMIAEA